MVPRVGVQPALPGIPSRALAAGPPRLTAIARSNDIVDEIKARSTLVALVQPAAWIGQLASHPAATAHTLGDIAVHVVHGEISTAGGELGGLVNGAMHPTGIAGGIYHAGLYAQAGVDALVGGVELYYGVKGKDTALKMMGAADLVGSASSVVFALGDGGAALGLNIASNTAKAAMVLLRPHDYSRIQKAKTVFDAVASMSSALMKAGIAPVPALAGYVGFGVTQIVYMNSKAFRGKVDAAVDWILAHLKP